jgi:hypothetical protein
MSQGDEGKAAGAAPSDHLPGEEDLGPVVSPRKDLIAAIWIGAFAILAIVLSLVMPNPGTLTTAPGLLPFLTGLSLLAMAVALAVGALRGGADLRSLRRPRSEVTKNGDDTETRRTLLLIALICVYVVLVDLVNFDWRLPTPVFEFRFSSFELISIPFLVAVLRIFWRQGLGRCLLVAAPTILVLTAIFQHGFKILLPGSG